jgi:hypothetical protein
MAEEGFRGIGVQTVWETRRTYRNFDELADDLRQRTGRSILHELDDVELDDLIAFVEARVPRDGVIVEKDRWSLWCGFSYGL